MSRRGLLSGLALVLPKCGLCLIGYVSAATGPELCGGVSSGNSVPWLVGMAGAAGLWLCRRRG